MEFNGVRIWPSVTTTVDRLHGPTSAALLPIKQPSNVICDVSCHWDQILGSCYFSVTLLTYFSSRMLQLKQTIWEVWYSRISQYPIWIHWRTSSQGPAEPSHPLWLPCMQAMSARAPEPQLPVNGQSLAQYNPPHGHCHTAAHLDV